MHRGQLCARRVPASCLQEPGPGKVLASRRPPGTEHPPRDDLAAHEVQHLNHLVPRSNSRVELLLQLPQR
eukprot:scaffold10215_cov47-Phaeocystis_antarctica.AAC.2